MLFIPSWKYQVLPKAWAIIPHLKCVLPGPSHCYSYTTLPGAETPASDGGMQAMLRHNLCSSACPSPPSSWRGWQPLGWIRCPLVVGKPRLTSADGELNLIWTGSTLTHWKACEVGEIKSKSFRWGCKRTVLSNGCKVFPHYPFDFQHKGTWKVKLKSSASLLRGKKKGGDPRGRFTTKIWSSKVKWKIWNL